MNEKNIRNAYRRSFENIGASEEFKNRTLEKMMAIARETPSTTDLKAGSPPTLSGAARVEPVKYNTKKNIAFSKYIVGITAAAACAVLTVAVIHNSPDRLASTTAKNDEIDNYITVYEPVDGEADEYLAPHNDPDNNAEAAIADDKAAENAEEEYELEEEEVMAGGAWDDDIIEEEETDAQPAEAAVTTAPAFEDRAETSAQTTVTSAPKQAETVPEAPAAAPAINESVTAPAAEESPEETSPETKRQTKKKSTGETDITSAAYFVAPAAPDEAPAAEKAGEQTSREDSNKTEGAVFFTDGEAFDNIIGLDGEIVEEEAAKEEAVTAGGSGSDTFGGYTDPPIVTGVTGVSMPAEVIVNQAEENSPEDFRSRMRGGNAVIFMKGNIDDQITLKRDDSTRIITVLTEHTGGHTISREAPGGYDYIIDIQSPKDFLRFYVSADSVTVRTADSRGIIYVSYSNNTAKGTVDLIINN